MGQGYLVQMPVHRMSRIANQLVLCALECFVLTARGQARCRQQAMLSQYGTSSSALAGWIYRPQQARDANSIVSRFSMGQARKAFTWRSGAAYSFRRPMTWHLQRRRRELCPRTGPGVTSKWLAESWIAVARPSSSITRIPFLCLVMGYALETRSSIKRGAVLLVLCCTTLIRNTTLSRSRECPRQQCRLYREHLHSFSDGLVLPKACDKRLICLLHS